MLYELVYNSAATAADLAEADLAQILGSARTVNRRLSITGVLLYLRGEFVQLLEGEREDVRGLFYDVIRQDPRHRGVSICWEQHIEERGFPDWSMGFARAANLDPAATPGLAGCLTGGLASLDLSGPASPGRRLLLSVSKSMQADADHAALGVERTRQDWPRAAPASRLDRSR